MKSEVEKQKFVELRSSGLSLTKISKEINVSKPTLIKWCKELEVDLHNQKAIVLDDLKEHFVHLRKNQFETIALMLTKIEKQMTERSLDDLSSDKMIKLYLDLQTIVDQKLSTTFKGEDLVNCPELFKPNLWEG